MWTCWWSYLSDKYIWNWWKLYFRISTNTSDQKKCDLWVLFSLSVTWAKLNFHLNKSIMMKLGQIHVIRKKHPQSDQCALVQPGLALVPVKPTKCSRGGRLRQCVLFGSFPSRVKNKFSPAVCVKAWFSIWSFVFHLSSCKMVKMS